MGLALAGAGWGQGQIIFNNGPAALGGGGAPVFEVNGTTRLAGPMFLAQLYAGPTAESLAPIGIALPFRTGAGAGYVDITGYDPVIAIPTVTPGDLAYIQMRAWYKLGGDTYEAAATANSAVGKSEVVTVKTGGEGTPPSLPATLTELKSFNISKVPTPPGGGATVLFSNSAATLGTAQPILGVDGVGLTGTGYLAQLWAGPSPESLAPIGEPLTFRTTGTKGILVNSSPDRSIPTVAPGAVACFQVRAWAAVGGDNWEGGSSYPFWLGGQSGRSYVWQASTGGGGQPPAPPTALVGMTSFSLSYNWGAMPIPEPSTLSLAGLGGVALAWSLRRKTDY
jgi:hypothetical protein